jgi:hypothetical protein
MCIPDRTEGEIDMDDQTRIEIYGMPFEEWKSRYQTDATPQQKADFAVAFKENVTDKS